jgi:hypothetical protein
MAARYKLKLKSLSFLSAVDRPAQSEVANAVLCKREGDDLAIELRAEVAKVSEELGLVFGWAFASSLDGGATPYHDLQGDAIDEDFVAVAAKFMEGGAATDVQHDGEQDGRVVFAMPLTKEIASALGIESKTLGLAVAIKPSPEVFAKFKSGELKGFSIAGTGERMRKAADRMCKGCNAPMDSAHKFCPSCGAAMKSAEPLDHKQAEKSTMTDQDKAEKAALEERLAKAEKAAADATAQIATEKAAMEARVAKAEQAAKEAAEAAAVEKSIRETVELEKRADKDIPLLKGDVKVRAALLKAVDSISDEATRKSVHESLASANGAYALLAKSPGHGGGDNTGGDAKTVFAKGLAAFAKAKGKAEHEVTAEFMKGEGREMYLAAYPAIAN